MEPASSAKTPRQPCPGAPLPLPLPPQEKNQQPTRKCFPINLASPVRPRDRSHRQAPIRESSASDPCTGPPPKTSKRPRVDVIKNAHLEPSCYCSGTATGSFQQPPQKERNRDVCPRNGPGLPLTGPSPGANPPIYPSSLPLACGNLLSNIFPKSHGFFFFCISTSYSVQRR